jgi:heat shock protein HslJ
MRRVTIAVALATLAAGCSGPTGPSNPAPLSERIGGIWTLTSRQLPGESAVPPPANATFTFQILDGRAGVRADCNQCGGTATIGVNSLTVGPTLACTRAFCSTSAPYDTTFVQVIAGDNLASVDDDTLTLQSDRGTLRFRR